MAFDDPTRPKRPRTFEEAYNNPAALDDSTASATPDTTTPPGTSFEDAYARVGADAPPAAPKPAGAIDLSAERRGPVKPVSKPRRGIVDLLSGAMDAVGRGMTANVDRPTIDTTPIADDPETAARHARQAEDAANLARSKPLAPVVITAPAVPGAPAPHRPDRAGGGLASAIGDVFATTRGGVESGADVGAHAAGGTTIEDTPPSMTERDYLASLNSLNSAWQQATDPARKRELQRTILQLNRQYMLGKAIHPDGGEGFVVGLTRGATMGFAPGSANAREAKKALASDVEQNRVVTPSDIADVGGTPHGGTTIEAPSGTEAAGEFAGMVLPFEAAERGGLGALRAGGRALEGTRIGDLLGAVGNLHAPIRYDTDIGEMVGKTVRGAAGGQIGGAVVAAGNAASSGHPEAIPEAIADNAGFNAALGAGLGSLGALGREADVAGRNREFGARLNYASDLVEGTRPGPVSEAVPAIADKTPLGDKTVEGQRSLLAKLLGDHLGNATAARESYPADVAAALDASPLHQPAGADWWEQHAPAEPQPSPIIQPETYGGSRESKLPDDRLRTAREAAFARAGIDPNSPTDAHDLSKRLVAEREMQQILAEDAERDAMQQRLDDAAAARPENKQGPLPLSTTLARAARENPADAADVSQREPVELGEGKTLTERLANSPNMNRYAAAALPAAGAAKTDDEKKRAALLGAAVALGTGDVGGEGGVFRVPKQFLGVAMKALREADATGSGASWVERIRAATDGKLDITPVLREIDERVRAAGGEPTDEYGRTELVKAIGEAANRKATPTDVQTLPAKRVIPWNERENGGQMFFSRMRNAVEDMPDKPMTAAQWYAKLKDNPNFSNTELEWTIGRSLRAIGENAAQDPEHAGVLRDLDGNPLPPPDRSVLTMPRAEDKLTKRDILDMFDQKQIQLGHEQLGAQPYVPGEGERIDPDSEDAVANARNDEIDRRLEAEIEEARNEYDRYAERARSYYDDAQRALADIGIPERKANDILSTAREEGYAYSRDELNTDRAWEHIEDDIREYAEPKDVSMDDLPYGWKIVDAKDEYEQNADQLELGVGGEEGERPPEPDYRYEVRDEDGNVQGRGDDEDEAIRQAAEEGGYMPEHDFDFVQREISAYLEAEAEASDAEREVYDREDGDPDYHRERIERELDDEDWTPDDVQAETGRAPMGDPTQFHTYQRFSPRGHEYREHVVTLDGSGMPDMGSFTRTHGSHFDPANAIGHYRAEIYDARPYGTPDEEALAPYKEAVQRAADAMDEFDRQLQERGVNPTTGEGATPEDFERAKFLHQQHEMRLRELGDFAARDHEVGEPQRTFVGLEFQSDLVQRALGSNKAPGPGFKRLRAPMADADLAAMRLKAADLRDKERLADEEYKAKVTLYHELRGEMSALEVAHSRASMDIDSARFREFNDTVDARGLRPASPEAEALFSEISARRPYPPELTEQAERIAGLRQRADDIGREMNLLRDQVIQHGAAAYDLEATLENPEIENPSGLMPTPFATSSDVTPMLVKSALWDAVHSGAERFAWSSAESRMALASLSKDRATRIYDEVVPSAVKKIFDFFGEPAEFEDIGIGGYKLKSVKLTPEFRERVKKVGLPLLGALMMVHATSEDAKAEGANDREARNPFSFGRGLFAAAGVLALVAGSKSAREAFGSIISDDMRERIRRDPESGLFDRGALDRAKATIDNDPTQSWAVIRQARDTRPILPLAMGRSILRALDDAGLPAQAFRTREGYAIALPNERVSGALARIEDIYAKKGIYLKSAVSPTFDAADATSKELAKSTRPTNLGVVLYANPIGAAMREAMKYPSAAALAALGLAAQQSDDERIRDTGMPLLALAALSAVGSDRLASMGEAATSKLVENLRQSKSGRAAVRFLNPEALLPKDLREAIVRYEEGISAGKARGAEIAKRSRDLGPVGDRAVSDVVENEQWEDISHLDPKDVQNILTVAAQYAQDFVKLGNEKVAAGVLTPSELLPDYAGPRKYAEHEAGAVMANDETSFRGTGSGDRVRISAQKSRTLDEPIRDAERALVDARASGDPQAIQDAEDKLHEAKLIQLQVRLNLGEIRESSYRGAQGMEKGYRDIAAAKLLSVIRQHPNAIHPEFQQALDEYDTARTLRRNATTPADRAAADDLVNQARVDMATIGRRFQTRGGDYVTLPSSAGLGDLAGMVVKREIAQSVNGLPDLKGWGTVLRFWKEAKTVFNPGTHLGNVLSNVGFAHLEGLSMMEQPRYLVRAALDLHRYGPGTKALAENGVLNFNAVTADNVGIAAHEMRSEEGLRELARTTRPETAAVLAERGVTPDNPSTLRQIAPYAAGAALGGAYGYYEAPDNAKDVGFATGAGLGLLAGSRPAREFSKRLYSNEDNIYRVAIYLKKIDDGMTPVQAADYAKDALGNFRSRSPALHVLRGTVAPFVLYPAKAVPRFAKQIVDHPWRYVTLMATWALMDQYSRAAVGPVDQRDLAIRDRTRLGYFFPGFTQLPIEGSAGEKGAVDVSRWTPIGSVSTAAPPGSFAGTIDERAPALLSGSGPIGDAAVKFIGNKDPNTGDPIVKPDYPKSDNLRAGLEAAADIVLPPAAAFHRQRIVEDVANADQGALSNDVLGPTGLRPRYVRPGGQAMNAAFQLQNSLQAMQQDLTRALRKSKSPDRTRTLVQQYADRVRSAFANYRDRMGEAPPDDLVQQAETFGNEQLDRHE